MNTLPAAPRPDASQPSALKMRPACEADVSALVSIVSSSADWYAPFVTDEDLAEHDVDEAWARKNLKKRKFYIGSVDGDAVGTVSLQDAGQDVYLGYVYLHADHTGHGYGRELLDFARDRAHRAGFSGMVLIAHPSARWAIKAYERYGFTRIAHAPEDVLAWNDGWLKPYYEQGFHLYRYAIDA